MAENRGRRRKHYIPKMAVVCAAAVLACGITAVAAGHSEFFRSIFGSKGREDIAAHEMEDEEKGTSFAVADMEWEEPDAEAAEKLLGDHVVQVGESVTVGGVTLTVEEYVIDENGIGALTYILSDPDGLSLAVSDYGYCELRYEEPSEYTVAGPIATSTEGRMFDYYSLLDSSVERTETEARAVLYFAPYEELEEGEGIRIGLVGYAWDENNELVSKEEQVITFVPDNFVSSRTLASDDGYTVRISPVGILFEGALFETAESEEGTYWRLRQIVITYEDGSVYQVEGEDISNVIFGCYDDNGSLIEVFNRMVDVDQVVSVTVNGPDGADLVFAG